MAQKEEEGEKSFKIVDKRRFTTEGEVRPDAPPDVSRAEPAAEQPRPEPRPAPPRPEARAERPRAQAPGPERPPEPGERRIDFLTFVASLATNALGALGALPEDRAQGMPVSPELAREYIDILAMLQEKTRGNLTAQEEQVLQRLVSDLRLHYVELTGGRR